MPVSARTSVLVVEDEALLLFSISDDLRELGFDVLEASTADQAIVQLERNDGVNVVFTDIDMPGSMNGLELAARLAEAWPEIGVIVTSGKQFPGSHSLPGDAPFVPKPYSTNAVAALIRSMAQDRY